MRLLNHSATSIRREEGRGFGKAHAMPLPSERKGLLPAYKPHLNYKSPLRGYAYNKSGRRGLRAEQVNGGMNRNTFYQNAPHVSISFPLERSANPILSGEMRNLAQRLSAPSCWHRGAMPRHFRSLTESRREYRMQAPSIRIPESPKRIETPARFLHGGICQMGHLHQASAAPHGFQSGTVRAGHSLRHGPASDNHATGTIGSAPLPAFSALPAGFLGQTHFPAPLAIVKFLFPISEFGRLARSIIGLASAHLGLHAPAGQTASPSPSCTGTFESEPKNPYGKSALAGSIRQPGRRVLAAATCLPGHALPPSAHASTGPIGASFAFMRNIIRGGSPSQSASADVLPAIPPNPSRPIMAGLGFRPRKAFQLKVARAGNQPPE